MFHAVKQDTKFPQLEEQILGFWKQNNVYQRSLELRKHGTPFFFLKALRLPTDFRIPGIVLHEPSKIYFLAIVRCEAISANEKPAGGYARTPCRSGSLQRTRNPWQRGD